MLAATTCSGQNATIVGSSAGDQLPGTFWKDVIAGLGGPDTIEGREGDDAICGGSGDDSIKTGDGANSVKADDGNDNVVGGQNPDVIYGGAGGDTLVGGPGVDRIDGGPAPMSATATPTTRCSGAKRATSPDSRHPRVVARPDWTLSVLSGESKLIRGQRTEDGSTPIHQEESPVRTSIRKSAVTIASLSALGLGGAAFAGAADNGTSTDSSQARATRPQRQALSGDVAAKVKAAALAKVPDATVLRTEAGGPFESAYHAHIRNADGTRSVVLINSSFEATAVQADRGRGPGDRRGGHRGGAGETPLTGETKEKVEAAALAKLPGATIIRTETNNDSTAPYESHVRKRDGTEAEVLVSKSFEVVEVRERPARP